MVVLGRPVREAGLEDWESTMTLLVWAAYVLTAMYVHTRVRAHLPHWEGRAEFAATGVAFIILFVLSILVTQAGLT
jgi:hypothetical protein